MQKINDLRLLLPRFPIVNHLKTIHSHIAGCLVSLLLLAFGLPNSVLSQGFSTFNGRNHPELDWQEAETPRFKIMYPAHLAGIEVKAAAIAEETYDALSENLEVTFDQKIRIYLSDEDEILNGFAVRLGEGFTNIWVHVNDVAQTWSGNTKWLRTVLAHELAHIFHYRAVKSNTGTLDFFFGNPLPRFWTEGLAQYQTEKWSAYRGEQWLRTAVLDDRLSYNDNRSAWNGRLLYASGNSQVRYFAEQYGDSSLVDLLQYRDTLLFKWSVHDFYKGLKKVTGKTYRQFYDDWRRHINVHYNTLAGQLETIDSLGVEPMKLPGQYLYDIQYSPDSSKIAILALTSLSRPIRRLYIRDRASNRTTIAAEGSINEPVAWRPDGTGLIFSRNMRGTYGALANDLLQVNADGKKLTRMTKDRRATSPSFAPDGKRIVFVGSESGTANLFQLNLDTGEETPLTRFSGDIQIAVARWHPFRDWIAFSKFDETGNRDIWVLNLEADTLQRITNTTADEHNPVWHFGGSDLAYTSLVDQVPNVFIYSFDTGTSSRLTNLVSGATAHQWLGPDTTHTQGRILITSSTTKQGDKAFQIDPERKPHEANVSLPSGYLAWQTHRPPRTIPDRVQLNPGLVQDRRPYRALRNLTRVTTLGIPYYSDASDWGVAGTALWIEPLGKHLIAATGGISFPSLLDRSFFFGSYTNNTFYPSLALNLYAGLPLFRAYGTGYLVESLTGADISGEWPLNNALHPYTATRIALRGRFAEFAPLDDENFDQTDLGLPFAEGRQTDLKIGLLHYRRRPYARNLIHPLDGYGLKVQFTGGMVHDVDTGPFLRSEIAGYGILPGGGMNRIFLHASGQLISGTVLPQHRTGFAEFDDIQISASEIGFLAFTEAHRVRGYRQSLYGDRSLFGSIEYRMPFLPDLQTNLLGVLALGSTTLSLFADAGTVWSGTAFSSAEKRVGVGLELKNILRIANFLNILHAVGVAQPADLLGTEAGYEVYYRIRTALPF